MEHVTNRYGELSARDPHNQAGLEVRSFDDGFQVPPPNPAGLEVEPRHDLILSRDDEKMTKMEFGKSARRLRKFFGLSARAFWIVFAVFVLVVIAITVGAGVGTSKHSGNSVTPIAPTSTNPSTSPTTSPPPTSAITTTNSTSAPTTTAENGGCKNGTTYTTTNTPFLEFCKTDFKVSES